MKFLIVAPRFHTNLYFTAISLQNAGHQVKAFTLYKGKSEYYKDIDIQVFNLSSISRLILSVLNIFKKNYLKTTFELRIQSPNKKFRQEIKKYQPDVIILKAYQEMLALKTLIIAKFLRTRVLMLTQTPYTHIKGSVILFRINIWLFKKLGLHAYVTPIFENYKAFSDFGIKNVHYLPFVYPAVQSVPNFVFGEGFKILSIGKFVKRKNHLLLIQAVEQLLGKYKIQLQIVGELADMAYYQQIDDYIRQHWLHEFITLKLNMPYNEIIQLYGNFHLFVLPATEEPAAYSPVEAMANGLPVICSSRNGTKCYIKHGINGFIFEDKNLDNLIRCIEKNISNKDTWHRMASEALTIARQSHNLKDHSDKIISIATNRNG